MKKYKEIKNFEPNKEPFELVPINFSKRKYKERIDRNIGWITSREQEILRFATIGIAGCGGMGGLLAAILLRTGIGKIKIADPEAFDISNINRQLGATKHNIGQSKAIATAAILREIADDTSIIVYPAGINESSTQEFLRGCDVIADEIEFWNIGSRLLLHERIPIGTTIMNANSVGMGTRIFRFTSASQWKMQDLLKISLGQAQAFENRLRNNEADREEIKKVQELVLNALVPAIPEYILETKKYSTKDALLKRLFNEGKASILASNPPMAAGFLANHIILEILRKLSPLKRNVIYPPDMPGYLLWDAATMQAQVIQTIWWN